MRTRRAVIVCMIALGLLMVSSIRAVAQSVSDEKAEIEAWVRARERGSILVPTPVLDTPFSGETVTTWHPPSKGSSREWRVTARYYRDSLGRVRVEQTFIGHAADPGPRRVIVAADPGSRMVYALDPVERTVTKVPRSYAVATVESSREFVMPVTMWCVIGFFRPGLKAPLQEESLGQQTIDGVRAEGTRVRALLPLALGRGETMDERWASPELRLDVFGRSEDADIGVVEHRLTTISRTEPQAELFEVPADYKPIGLFQGATWLNPYSPEIWPKLSPLAKSNCGATRPPGF
jgi:hypothetical protein